jgi:colanic acid biosynthesis protein WcaH
MLSPDKYIKAIELTQIVSVDLICRDEYGKILLGKRINKPAKDFWFVPGGRVFKDERIHQAVPRICKYELGVELSFGKFKFIGVNDHIYNDNFCDKKDIGSHYVCLAFETMIKRTELDMKTLLKQHSNICWMKEEDILYNPDVHTYTQKYFTGEFNWVKK